MFRLLYKYLAYTKCPIHIWKLRKERKRKRKRANYHATNSSPTFPPIMAHLREKTVNVLCNKITIYSG
jgi:hypothetical protein